MVYTGPFEIIKTTTVKAIAVKTRMQSDIAEAEYINPYYQESKDTENSEETDTPEKNENSNTHNISIRPDITDDRYYDDISSEAGTEIEMSEIIIETTDGLAYTAVIFILSGAVIAIHRKKKR